MGMEEFLSISIVKLSPFYNSDGCTRSKSTVLLLKVILLLLLLQWRQLRSDQTPNLVMEDFDAELEIARSQVVADPRVAADVIKLWMRA